MLSDFAAPYVTTTQLVASMASIPLAYGIYKIFAFVYDELTSPIRHVPGPPNPSFIYGSFKQLSESVSRKAYTVLSCCSFRIERLHVGGGLDQPIRTNNSIQSDIRCELIIIDHYIVIYLCHIFFLKVESSYDHRSQSSQLRAFQ